MTMVIKLDIETAMTVKNMLAMAVADAPETLHPAFSEARAMYLQAISEAKVEKHEA